MKSPAPVYLLISALSLLAGTWEITVTRLGSLLYFLEITYVIISACLLGFGIGAVIAPHDAGTRTS